MCQALGVTRSGYYKWMDYRNRPYKYHSLLTKINLILEEYPENQEYGIRRMYEALCFRFSIKESQSTIARVMRENNLIHRIKRKPSGLTKANKEAQKADNLIHRQFSVDCPNTLWVTDITQLPTNEGPLYISGIFDCFDNSVISLTMADNMRKELVIDTVSQAMNMHPNHGVILHSDRGSQYTSHEFKASLKRYGIKQSMNSAGGRCHDNAKCESMWARFKVEKIYHKIKTDQLTMAEVRQLVFRYFMSYWNNRRICSANGGLPPLVKRERFYANLVRLKQVA